MRGEATSGKQLRDETWLKWWPSFHAMPTQHVCCVGLCHVITVWFCMCCTYAIGILDFLVHFQLFPVQQVTFCEIEVVNPWAFFASISAEDMITFLIVGTSLAPKG